MLMPSQPVTLTVEQIGELNRHKPDTAERMMTTLGEQPPRIAQTIKIFSDEFERTMHITRP